MMKRVLSAILILFILFLPGLTGADAQPVLERISITERADTRGYVIRYHLSEIAVSYKMIRPRDDLILIELSSPGFTVSRIIPITQADPVRDIELTEIPDGVGVTIHVNEGYLFKSELYPDVNGRDMLLSLEIAAAIESANEVSDGEYFEWYEGDMEESYVTEVQLPVAAEELTVIPDLESRWGVQLGVMAGISSSSAYAANFSADSRQGASFGLSAVISSPFLLQHYLKTGIETGVFFSQKGFEVPEPQFLDGEVFEFDYVDVPVLLKISYPLLQNVSSYILAGPSIGFMVNAERVHSDGDRNDLDELTKSVHTSAVAGAGLDLHLFETIVSVQLRYHLSASLVFKDETEIRDIARFRHRYLLLAAGIRF